MAASDVVALTSDNEGTPVSLIEAQAAGVPVVGTNVGGVAAAVQDGQSGILVRPADETAFADALRRVLLDRALESRFGTAGRKNVRDRFSLDRLIRDIDELYRRLLSAAT
jgi:glycosyltransferase involved in cell wall biosynthesis